MNRRDESKENARRKRDREREAKHSAVNENFMQPRKVIRRQRHERIRTPEREQQSQAATRKRQDQAFRQQEPQDSRAARAQSSAYRKLFLSRGSAREQKVRDVRTGYQQQKRHRAEEHKQGRANLFHRLLARCDKAYADTSVGVGVLLFEPAFDGGHFSSRLLDRCAGLKPPYGEERIVSVRCLFFCWSQRNVEFDRIIQDFSEITESNRKLKTRRHHSHNRVGLIVEGERLTDDSRIRTKALSPNSVTQNN